MPEKTIRTRPLNENEKLLRQKFYENIVAQSELIDRLSGQLLTVELAIPGLYATSLKLVKGDSATVNNNISFYITFACWLLALISTLIALTPRKWNVDTSVLKKDPEKLTQVIGIEDFFEQVALYKRRMIVFSCIFFFAGIFSAAFTLV